MAQVHTASPPGLHLASIATGLLGGAGVAALLASRLGLTAWEAVQTTCQVLLFVLGSWLLPRGNNRLGPSWALISTVGMLFAFLRLVNYIRVAVVAPTPLPEYAPIFSTSPFAYAVFGFYIAESMFMQVLLHRVLPGWACTLLGALQALLWFKADLRYNAAAQLSVWRVIRMAITPQVGMFAPYYMLTHRSVREMFSKRDPPCAVSGIHEGKAVYSEKSITSEDGLPVPSPAGQQSTATAVPASASAPVGLLVAHRSVTGSGIWQETGSAAMSALREKYPGPGSAVQRGVAGAPAGTVRSAAAAVKALSKAPYQSRLRASHKVCVKLDTRMPCDALPDDLAQQLQAALKMNIGQATSVHITDLAVRAGCICISMGLEEQAITVGRGRATSQLQLQADEVAQALLPALQAMLSAGQHTAAIPRATVQVDDSLVTCAWKQDLQAWDVQRHPTCRSEQAMEDNVWLGVASVYSTEIAPAGASSSLAATRQSTRLLNVLAQVQLWGVSKVADVEGWTPPPQHQDSELQWPDALQPSGSSPALKLLARAAGGYLPTRVMHLVQGETHDYVMAQVLVQLHEHQLVRHHEGGSPSTVLLLDLELWQNEVLLSSSPLLSLPAVAETSRNSLATHAWWWGAADSTVADALAEMASITQELLLAAGEDDAPEAIQTFVQYMQDLVTWLAQVQCTACSSQLCHSRGAVAATSQAAAALHPPNLPPSALKLLAQELAQYASRMGWKAVKRMVHEQLQTVVAPAAAGHWQLVQRSFGFPFLVALYTALLGYPCHHDEQLYKQQLAVHLSGVLTASSTATAVIGFTWYIRALGWDTYTPLVYMSLSWSLMHATAAISVWVARTRKQRAAQAVVIKFALRCTMAAYLWRILIHVIMAALAKPGAMYLQTYQHTHVWVGMHAVLLLTEQVPASAVLPAKFVTAIGCLLEFPALACDVLRASSRDPTTSVTAAFVVVVVVWTLLDAHLRKQLSRTHISRMSAYHHNKVE